VRRFLPGQASVTLAEREGEARPRLTLRRVVQEAADDDRELMAGMARYWGLGNESRLRILKAPLRDLGGQVSQRRPQRA
jgi:hypothetical protein